MSKKKDVKETPAAEAVDNTAAAPEISEVEKLQLELAEQQAKYLYLQAEYQNFRKRAARGERIQL
jgi:molecular chaperone GrpE (heat shock protein)